MRAETCRSPRTARATAPSVEDTLAGPAARYPAPLVDIELADVPRIAFHLRLVIDHADGGPVCDVGGGLGLLSIGCAALGVPAILADDFRDDSRGVSADTVLAIHRSLGVEILERDVTRGLALPPGSLGAVTCFHSIEHWHGSPKTLFADLLAALRPGGLFLLAAPNAVNLRKRLAVPLGYGTWSPFSEWYDAQEFRGHVREPTVQDLQQIGRRLGLEQISIFGRNWLGLSNPHAAVRAAVRVADRLLRLRPSLCSDIYLMGKKRRP
jgi:SAM-dependent methyltransferase